MYQLQAIFRRISCYISYFVKSIECWIELLVSFKSMILLGMINQCYLLILIRNIDCLWYYKFLKQVDINVEEICSSWKTSFHFQLIIPSVKHLFPRESFVSFSARALYYTSFFSLHFICIECESGKMSQGKIIQV